MPTVSECFAVQTTLRREKILMKVQATAAKAKVDRRKTLKNFAVEFAKSNQILMNLKSFPWHIKNLLNFLSVEKYQFTLKVLVLGKKNLTHFGIKTLLWLLQHHVLLLKKPSFQYAGLKI